MATPQADYSRRLPLRQHAEGTQIGYTATSRTRGLPFDDFAGTPPPARRETERPRQARKPILVKVQLSMNMDDPEDVALTGSGIRTNDADEDNSASGPMPLPVPARPKPFSPRNSTVLDIRDIHAPPDSPQMFDWLNLAPLRTSLSISEQNNHGANGSNSNRYRDYAAYEQAQAAEKDGFLKLLSELCQGIAEPPQSTGRPKMLMRDMVYSVVHKVYSLFSYRRHTRELREAKVRGYVSHLPEFSTVCRYMRNPEMTHILMDLVASSAIPMQDIDAQAISESTEFPTCHFVRWFNRLWGGETNTRERLRVNLTHGVDTRTISAVVIPGWFARDTNFFKPLPDRTVAHFDPESLAEDLARPNNKNEHWAMLEGVAPFIPFRSNISTPTNESNSVWAAMQYLSRANKGELHRHYRHRNNIKTAAHIMKSKFGDSLRSKNYLAQINETLAKVLSHNIVENYKLAVMMGLDINFGSQVPAQERMV